MATVGPAAVQNWMDPFHQDRAVRALCAENGESVRPGADQGCLPGGAEARVEAHAAVIASCLALVLEEGVFGVSNPPACLCFTADVTAGVGFDKCGVSVLI